MSCQGYEDQIGDYVDGTMNEAERASFESHLTSCASCQAMVSDFMVIRTASLSLEPQVPPPQVWGRIAAPSRRNRNRCSDSAAPHGGGRLRLQRRWLSWLPRCRGRAAQLTPVPGQRLARVPTTEAEPVSILAEYQLAERDLTSTIEGLERIANSDRAALDMETADVKANLTVLDGAIGESREALKKEPENDVAQQSLFEALRNKVALLQDTIALINEMRKGNQEGAARIVSGLNQ